MTDAQIAREWAEGFIKYADSAEIVDADTLTAARHILATTTPPTMADVEWDYDVHAGLCALYAYGDTVLMLSPDIDNEGVIFCHYINFGSSATGGLSAENLTPIPGTKINLTPRREPVPESTPDHPTELTTEADYRNAPEGTIVAAEGKEAWTKGEDGSWETWGIISGYNNYVMADGPRRVLRWGWEA